jgi:hypothetical protein
MVMVMVMEMKREWCYNGVTVVLEGCRMQCRPVCT